MTSKLPFVKFNENSPYKTYLKSLKGYGYLYMDFSKAGFGFGEISLHQRKSKEQVFSCMNEMMPREVCADIITSCIMGLPKAETVSVVVKENAWEHLSIINKNIEDSVANSFSLESKNKAKKGKDVSPNWDFYIPSLNFEQVNLNVDEGVVTAVLTLDEKNQSFYSVSIEFDKIDSVSFFIPFYEKVYTVTPLNLIEMFSSDEVYFSGHKISAFLTAFFYKKWLDSVGSNAESFVKKLTYHEVTGTTMQPAVIVTDSPDVNKVKVNFLKDEDAFFAMSVSDGNKIHDVKIVQIKGFDKPNLYALKSSGGEDVIKMAFAKVLSNLILDDQEHMDLRELDLFFDDVKSIKELKNDFNHCLNHESSEIAKEKLSEFLKNIKVAINTVEKHIATEEQKVRYYDLIESRYSSFFVS